MFTVLRFAHSFFRHIFLLICFSAFMYGQSLPATNHNTSKNDAIRYINNFKVSPAATIIGIKGGAFNRGIIDTVLSQSVTCPPPSLCTNAKLIKFFRHWQSEVDKMFLALVDDNSNCYAA